MVQLEGLAVGETPTFAGILKERPGAEDVLFEEWEPSDTGAWAREIFTPFVYDDEVECPDPELLNCPHPETHLYGCGCPEDPEATVEAEQPEPLTDGVQKLQSKQVQSA